MIPACALGLTGRPRDYSLNVSLPIYTGHSVWFRLVCFQHLLRGLALVLGMNEEEDQSSSQSMSFTVRAGPFIRTSFGGASSQIPLLLSELLSPQASQCELPQSRRGSGMLGYC